MFEERVTNKITFFYRASVCKSLYCNNDVFFVILSVTNIDLMRLTISSSKQMQHLMIVYRLLYCEIVIKQVANLVSKH